MTELLNSLSIDSLDSLWNFLPELTLCATIALVLLLKVFRITSKLDSFYIVMAGSAVGLIVALDNLRHAGHGSHEIFSGMLIYDPFTLYFRVLLLAFVLLFAILTRISGIPDREAAPDFYCLALGATLGMCLMASSNHLMMVFLAVEMASVPSYCLAGALKGRRRSSEAALKYAVYGAGTAGVMLYGISLLAGVLGSVHIPTMMLRLAGLLQTSPGGQQYMVLALGGLMLMVGLSFKLSAVPFHFWCPDVFEGASAEVNAFLSVASKAAALALLVRVAIGLGYDHQQHASEVGPTASAITTSAATTSDSTIRAQSPAEETPNAAEPAKTEFKDAAVQQANNTALAPVRDFISKLLAFIAVITCTFGNLAAYGQTNIKRLLAYSTIAHAGYMIMPVAAAVALAGSDPLEADRAIGALVVYIGVYLFMNLGAFAIIALMRNVIGSEEIADYGGLIYRLPGVAVCLTIILVSLIGLPPMAGFTGKFLIFAALWKAGLTSVLVVAGVNTVISLFYYLRIVKVMTFEQTPPNALPITFGLIPSAYIVAITAPVLVLGIWWNELNHWALVVASHIIS